MWLVLASAILFNTSPDPFTYASKATGVPIQLLAAISRVESSHYPWALNIGGKGVYPIRWEEAEQILNRSPDSR